MKKILIKITTFSILLCLLCNITSLASSQVRIRDSVTRNKKTYAVGIGGYYTISKNAKLKKVYNACGNKISYINKHFVSIDFNSDLHSSKDGENWIKHKPSPAINFSAITYYKKQYIAIDIHNTIYTSNNLDDWKAVSSNLNSLVLDYQASDLIVFKKKLIVVMDNFSFSSPICVTSDIKNWKLLQKRKNTRYNNFKIINNTLYILGVKSKGWQGNITKVTYNKNNQFKFKSIDMKKGYNTQDIIKKGKNLIVLSNNLKEGFSSQYTLHYLNKNKLKHYKTKNTSNGGTKLCLHKKLYILGNNGIEKV